MNSPRHIPVMLNEVLDTLKPEAGKIYVDATFGNGGYSEAILKTVNCTVIAIDRDPTVRTRAEEIKKLYGNRFEFITGTFGDIAQLIKRPVDGVVFDIGVSSMQIDEGERGFSYAKEADLDMRMSQEGISAKDIVNTLPEKELADLIYQYGEERKSRQIARAIAARRDTGEIRTTTELAELIYGIIPPRKGQTDPATRTFQALRIAVNDELHQLEAGLWGALNILRADGRIVVVDFHSLEDRIVKNFFAANTAKKVHVSRYKEPDTDNTTAQTAFSFSSKAILPSERECRDNPRAHSAKLRYAIKRKEQNNE